MKKYKEIKQEILTLIDLYCSKHNMSFNARITQEENTFQIKIFEKTPLYHHPLMIKSITRDEFLALNKSKIKKLISEIFEDYEEYPHPGPGFHK